MGGFAIIKRTIACSKEVFVQNMWKVKKKATRNTWIRYLKNMAWKYLLTLIFLCIVTLEVNAATKFMIYGGQDHDKYLGCLCCSEYSIDSVHNEYSTYGSSYSSESIFNEYGTYGSEYSSESPCNELALSPPIIVDQNGKFYGYLTLNELNSKRTTSEKILSWLKYKVCKKKF